MTRLLEWWRERRARKLAAMSVWQRAARRRVNQPYGGFGLHKINGTNNKEEADQ